MNDHTLDMLQYGELLALIATHAATDCARQRLLQLRPLERVQDVESTRELYRAFLAVRQAGITVRRADFESPEEALRRVVPFQAVLDSEDFLILRRLLQEAQAVRRFFQNTTCQSYPVLTAFAEATPVNPQLLQRLERTFDDKGNIEDNASDRLWEIRQSIRRLEKKISQQLEALLQSSDLEDVFHDKFVALRNNRYVVPVKRELKSRLRGVVHDQSNSGRTIFLEPELILEEGNALATFHLEERDEIRRILAALSDLTRDHREELLQTFAQLVRYDMAYAISAWGDSYHCDFPRFDKKLRLQQARHPLLQHQFRQEKREAQLVPLDLELDPEVRVLAITGSNTGGKTIVLKTVGLLVAAAQTGLPVPASPNSSLCFFPGIAADIGDEQSIAQSLSTFSGHLRNISQILTLAERQRCLVLIDELGAGTDPIEGGALGCAILETLVETVAVTFFTTHLGMIKNYVHEHERMLNANVRFNAESLQPEYVLEVGRPGASHALTIAGRCGLPGHVLDKARALLSSDHLDMEQMLASIEEKERSLADDLATAREARDKVLMERDTLREELDALRKQRKKMLHDAQREAGSIVDNTRREMENLLDKARQAGKADDAKALRQSMQRKSETLHQSIEQTAPKPPSRLKHDDLHEGLRVWVPVLNDHGIIASLAGDKQRASVEVDGKRFDIKTNQLTPARNTGEEVDSAPRTHVHKPAASNASQEINLIGLRVEEALPKLERFLDTAMLAGFQEVRIIHGFGTGQLRKGIHEYLKGSSVVLDYRLGMPQKDPGGGGATTVKLA